MKRTSEDASASEALNGGPANARSWSYRAVLWGAFAAYLLLAIGSAASKAPWADEGFLTGIAYSLRVYGVLGSPTLEPGGLGYIQLPNVDQFTYWHMPLYFLLDAALGQLVDLSPLGIRALSLVAGLVALAAFHVTFRALLGKQVGLLSTVLLATSYTFVQNASTARMDMLGASFAALAYASYLSLRTRTLFGAILAGHAFVTAASLTHPLAAMVSFPTLLCLIVAYDRSRIAFCHVVLSAVPYLVGGIAWLLYVLRAPPVFLMQFGANLTVDGRMGFLSSPLESIVQEITHRYTSLAGFTSSDTLPRVRLVIVIMFALSALASVVIPSLRRNKAHRFVLCLVVLQAATLALFDGRKDVLYLIHTVPMLVALTAATASALSAERLVPPWTAAAALLGFVLINASGSVYLIVRNDCVRTWISLFEFCTFYFQVSLGVSPTSRDSGVQAELNRNS